jgi:hypothetical protein
MTSFDEFGMCFYRIVYGAWCIVAKYVPLKTGGDVISDILLDWRQ